MTDLDYAIQRMRDAIDTLERVASEERGEGYGVLEETLDDIQGGLDDAYVALNIENPSLY